MVVTRKHGGWLSFAVQVAVLDAALVMLVSLFLDKFGLSDWHRVMVRGLMHYCTFLCG